LSKPWKPNPFAHLEKGLNDWFLNEQEKVLNSDHNWQPHISGYPTGEMWPPINGEY